MINWQPVLGADEDAPRTATMAVSLLKSGVYQRVLAGSKQVYIFLGHIETYTRLCERAGFPATTAQPLNVQVAVMEGRQVEDVVVSAGDRLLWSDDIVVNPLGYGNGKVLFAVSRSSAGERPTEAPLLGPYAPREGSRSRSPHHARGLAMGRRAAPKHGNTVWTVSGSS